MEDTGKKTILELCDQVYFKILAIPKNNTMHKQENVSSYIVCGVPGRSGTESGKAMFETQNSCNHHSRTFHFLKFPRMMIWELSRF